MKKHELVQINLWNKTVKSLPVYINLFDKNLRPIKIMFDRLSSIHSRCRYLTIDKLDDGDWL